MSETVSVYVNVRENGTLSISVDVPLDFICQIQTMGVSSDEGTDIEELAKNWMGTETQLEKTM